MSRAANAWRCAAGVFGLAGVALGAVAAHAVAPTAAAVAVERAALYLLLHAAALLALAPLEGRLAFLARSALALGVVLFSGSIALHHLAGAETVAALAPVGGTFLIAGWALVALAAARRLWRGGGT